MREGDQWVVYDNYHDDDAELRGWPFGDRRRDLTHKIQEIGILRQPHASMNSRCN